MVMLFVLISGCGDGKHSNEHVIRGDDDRALNECRDVVEGSITYETAAGFTLEIPAWVRNFPATNRFNADCKLTDMILSFAWADKTLIPLATVGERNPNNDPFPEQYEQFVLMMSFKPPHQEVDVERHCADKHPVYEFPEYRVRMCPFSMSGVKSPNIKTLPFYPWFELMTRDRYPANFGCSHSVFDGYHVDEVTQVEIPYSCRGYWRWRPGASAMFDIHHGKVIQKAYRVIEAAEKTMNSWVKD